MVGSGGSTHGREMRQMRCFIVLHRDIHCQRKEAEVSCSRCVIKERMKCEVDGS